MSQVFARPVGLKTLMRLKHNTSIDLPRTEEVFVNQVAEMVQPQMEIQTKFVLRAILHVLNVLIWALLATNEDVFNVLKLSLTELTEKILV